MNIHPILVHFPIALLTIYVLCELIRFKAIKAQPAWFYVKAVLVICGTLGAWAALFTGDLAKHAVFSGLVQAQVANPRRVIHLHESLADITVVIFTLLAAGYAVAWLNKFQFGNYLPGKLLKGVWQIGTRIQQIIIGTRLVIILAVAGLIAVTLTGALGGAIVYGPDSDPIIRLIYRLLIH